ncbi:MAG: hypothetical protein ACOX1P_19605 [Thermoguttaceae bacterium]|jgi:hypothetical protein
MTFGSRTVCAALLLAACVICAPSMGENPAPAGGAAPVELFSAIEQDQIDVKLIPKDSTLCRVLIENKTDQPLTVKLPEAFAGVPILKQGLGGGLGGMGGGLGGTGTGTGGYGGGAQSFGGGMGGYGGGYGGGGFGGGFMNVPAEGVGKLKITTVCLEHGKSEPRAAMEYEIKPIGQFTDKKEVHELCKMLGYRKLDQRVAQAAAWHLGNDMSWQELAAKELRFATGIRRPYFTPMEIQAAIQAATVAAKAAEEQQKSAQTDSLSQK